MAETEEAVNNEEEGTGESAPEPTDEPTEEELKKEKSGEISAAADETAPAKSVSQENANVEKVDSQTIVVDQAEEEAAAPDQQDEAPGLEVEDAGSVTKPPEIEDETMSGEALPFESKAEEEKFEGAEEKVIDERDLSGKALVDMSYDAQGTRVPGIAKGISSKAKLTVGSVISFRKYSGMEGTEKAKSRYQNTYKLNSDNPFNPEKVQKILENVMIEALDELAYDVEKCPKQAKWAAQTIRNKIKELEYDRYKLICIVTIGEKNSQDILVTSRFLWDTERDRHAVFVHENSSVFGIVQCFGLYYE